MTWTSGFTNGIPERMKTQLEYTFTHGRVFVSLMKNTKRLWLKDGKPGTNELGNAERGKLMAKYIDRDAFLAHERAWYCDQCDRRKNSKGKTVYEIGEAPCRACDIWDILDLLEDYPTADVVERKRGKWLDDGLDGIGVMGIEYRWQKCSECGSEFSKAPGASYPNYCSMCGADMRGDEH